MPTLLLAGDIGGTNSRLALFEIDRVEPGKPIPEPKELRRYPSRDPGGLVAILRRYLGDTGARPAAASFGLAGPVVGGKVNAPNLPFAVDGEELRAALGLPRITLLNDLEAAAWGLLHLDGSQVKTLQAGTAEPRGRVALIAAGTGLGEGMLAPVEGHYHAFPSEGGHCDFAPVDEEQIELLRTLLRSEGHVSYERVLSGSGLARIWSHLAGGADPPEPASISKGALEGSDPVAVRALRLFARIYGAEAGNLALRTLCHGGLYVAGGVAPKVLPFLEHGGFLEAFLAKGRSRRVVERIPVKVVLDERLPLLGAAARGAAGSEGVEGAG